jgi:hypothetical protein
VHGTKIGVENVATENLLSKLEVTVEHAIKAVIKFRFLFLSKFSLVVGGLHFSTLLFV